MPTIQEQIELEKRMVAYGITRYRHSVQEAESNERGGDTQYAQRLMSAFITPVATAITEYCAISRTGVKAKYRVLLSNTDPYKAAYFGLRALFNHFTKDESLAALGTKIGTMLEDEAKFLQFQKEHGDYYNKIIEDFKNKGTTHYRHMHRVLTHKANEKGVEWVDWTAQERAAVGVKVIDLIMESTDLIEKGYTSAKKKKYRDRATIKPSASALEWVRDFNHYAEMLNPDRTPCIIQPDQWTGPKQGGYYTPMLRSKTPLVKTRSKKHAAMFDADIPNILTAVNKVQDVAWQINKEVFDVMKQAWEQALPIGFPRSEPYIIPECPVPKTLRRQDMLPEQVELLDNWKAEARTLYTMERDRISKCFQVSRTLKMAQEFSQYDRLWFVWQCDFRGRLYCTSNGLSPQGADFSKAVIRFGDGEPLGKRGFFWLRVHGANAFGYDKVSYEERVRWIDDRHDDWLRAARDPLSHRDVWSGADKPWQFLAFLFEYLRYQTDGESMVSNLPIALDGSCNGLQNFSAMLRDEVGGSATNLTPADRPSDIYALVSRRVSERLDELIASGEKHEHLLIWQAYRAWLRDSSNPQGILPRGLSKRPVMTLPYGSTQRSCREYIYKFMVEDAKEFFGDKRAFSLATYLTPIMWQSIGEVVVAARKAMDWIQKCASIVGKENKPLIWWTPLGFPVYQDRKKVMQKQIHTELCGHFRLRLDLDSDRIDVQKQKLGASPNFVHSMDASHLMLLLNKASEYGIDNLACIHDSFGTTANKTDKLHELIRDAFVELYEDHDPLMEFKRINEETHGVTLPEPPARGNLNLLDVKDSRYFFG